MYYVYDFDLCIWVFKYMGLQSYKIRVQSFITLSFDHQWWNLIIVCTTRRCDIRGLWLMTSVSAQTKIQVYPGGKGEAVEEICKPSRKLTYLTFGKGTLYWPLGIC